MANKEKIRRPSNWTVINIKARDNQTPEHYVNLMRNIVREDPMVDIGRKHQICMKSYEEGPLIAETQIPQWIVMVFTTFVIVDPEAFYDIRAKKDVTIEKWNEDIVVNKREINTLFIPDTHTLAVRMSAEGSLKHIERYMIEAVERVEPETFDVTVIKSHDVVQRILDSHHIIKFDASVSFSNPGHTGLFNAAFDEKMREVNPSTCNIKMQGTQEKPLQNEADGLIEAIVSLSEQNGEVKATIVENNKPVVVNTKLYPARLRIVSAAIDLYHNLRNRIIQEYGEHNR